MKIIIPWVVAVLALGGVFYFHQAETKTAQTVAELQQQVQQLQAVKTENEQLKASQVSSDEVDRLRADSHELLKLRNEVQMLHGEQAKLKQAADTAQRNYQQVQTEVEQAQAQAQAAQAKAAQAQLLAVQRAAAPGALTPQSMMNACINNLRQIDAAKNQWALEKGKKGDAVPTAEDIAPYIRLDADGNIPKCPAGGSYTLNAVNVAPTCSIDGHVLP